MTIDTIREVEALPALTDLQQVILTKNIPVLDDDDVVQYQDEARLRFAKREYHKALAIAALILGTISLASLGYALWFISRHNPAAAVPVAIMGLASAHGLYFVRNYLRSVPLESIIWARWSTTNLPVYLQLIAADDAEAIPEEILERAEAIQQACPNAMLWVESLGADPFLRVGIPDTCLDLGPMGWQELCWQELYYIGVWNEQQFR